MNMMPKATDFTNSTTVARPFDGKHAESFRDLEGDICDLSAMAWLASREIDGVLESARTELLDNDGYDRVSFAIGHLRQMIDALKQSYYQRFEAARDATTA